MTGRASTPDFREVETAFRLMDAADARRDWATLDEQIDRFERLTEALAAYYAARRDSYPAPKSESDWQAREYRAETQ